MTVEPQGTGLETLDHIVCLKCRTGLYEVVRKYKATGQYQEWHQAPRMGKGGENLKEDKVTKRGHNGLFHCLGAQEAGPATSS